MSEKKVKQERKESLEKKAKAVEAINEVLKQHGFILHPQIEYTKDGIRPVIALIPVAKESPIVKP